MNETKPIDPQTVTPLVEALPAPLVWLYRAVPVAKEGKTLTVLMEDDSEVDALDSLCHLTQCRKIDAIVVETDELEKLMRRFFGPGERIGKRMRADALILRDQINEED